LHDDNALNYFIPCDLSTSLSRGAVLYCANVCSLSSNPETAFTRPCCMLHPAASASTSRQLSRDRRSTRLEDHINVQDITNLHLYCLPATLHTQCPVAVPLRNSVYTPLLPRPLWYSFLGTARPGVDCHQAQTHWPTWTSITTITIKIKYSYFNMQQYLLIIATEKLLCLHCQCLCARQVGFWTGLWLW
jgi:hypothetical protein